MTATGSTLYEKIFQPTKTEIVAAYLEKLGSYEPEGQHPVEPSDYLLRLIEPELDLLAGLTSPMGAFASWFAKMVACHCVDFSVAATIEAMNDPGGGLEKTREPLEKLKAELAFLVEDAAKEYKCHVREMESAQAGTNAVR